MDKAPTKKKNDWYNDFLMLSAVVVMLFGIGALGYGAIASISNSIKNRRVIKMNKQTGANTVNYNSAFKQMMKEESR